MNLTMPWNASKPGNNGWTAPIDDVKQQISQQVDRLVQVAAQVGRDVASQAAHASRDVVAQAAQVSQEAGLQAAGTARDVGEHAIKTTQGAASQAVAVARDVPSGATTLAQQLMGGAAQLGREIRSMRVTRQPAPGPRGPAVVPGVALLAGVGSGLALMYFFDPGEGRRRRALLRDQLTKWSRIGRKTAVGKAHDVRNRTVGLAHEARKAVVSRTGMDADMEEIASGSGSGSTTNGGYDNGYGSTDQTEQPATHTADQPQHSEVS